MRSKIVGVRFHAWEFVEVQRYAMHHALHLLVKSLTYLQNPMRKLLNGWIVELHILRCLFGLDVFIFDNNIMRV